MMEQQRMETRLNSENGTHCVSQHDAKCTDQQMPSQPNNTPLKRLVHNSKRLSIRRNVMDCPMHTHATSDAASKAVSPSILAKSFWMMALFLASQLYATNAIAVSTLTSTTVTTSIYDTYGNPTSLTVSTTGDNPSGASETYTTQTISTFTNTESTWHLGRLTRAEVTQTLPGGSNDTRTSAFAYDSNGLLIQETIEPDTPALRLITDHGYDAFGNKTSVTVSGGSGATAIASRTTTTLYDPRGQFATYTSNAVGHSETRTYNAHYGVMEQLTGPNDLDTDWAYDSFGRQISETRADGTVTTVTREWCNGFNGETGNSSCPVGGALSVTTQNTGAPTSVAYSDAFGRALRSQTQGFDSTATYVDTEYNHLGQVVAKSRPYFAGDSAYWSAIDYDALGRVIQTTGADGSVTVSSYQGLTVGITNDKGQTNWRINSVIGQLAETEDNEGNIATYTYDHFGNLTVLTDANGNTISNTYDLRGRKIAMDDPDMGLWAYSYNALGELISQTDAKSQSVTMSYDLLGRMMSRVEAEGTSTWVYDYPAGNNYGDGQAAHSIGKLISVSGAEGKDEDYSYDAQGRIDSTSTTITGTSASYVQSQTYDASGRVDTQTYPLRAHDNGRLKVQHQYTALGHLEKIVNADNTSEVYWQALAVNAEGQVTSQQYGNGVTTQSAFIAQTGLISAIGSSSPSGTNNIQDLTFDFDTLGNFILREDLGQSTSESFGYDTLNRLTSSTLGSVTKTYGYDVLGNLTSKTGIGSYSYGGSRPHAVTQVAGHNVNYDANGNVTQNYNFTSSVTRNLSWSSYNKPVQIDQGTTTLTFKYGAGRELFRQGTSANSNPTEYRYYINPVFEVDSKVGKNTYIHYIKAGSQTVGMFKSINDFAQGNDTEETRYLHRDHLGSITAITDETALVVESLSYDPHGKRRQPSWDDAASQIFTTQLSKCFTGHVYLEEVGLIHMSGRVYDPDLGRFISADPTIQYPEVQQNFNRYTYVNNNPLSYTDPSGFGFFSSLFKAIGKIIGGVVKAVVGVVKAVLNSPILRTVAAIAIAVFAPAALPAFVKGFAAGFVASGGDLKAGLIGAITAGAFNYVGHSDSFRNFANSFGQVGAKVVRTIAHGIVGGASQALRGGKFLAGFLSAGFSQALEQTGVYGKLSLSNPTGPGGYAQNAVVSAVVGGTASVLGGGKFKNGALTGAFSRLFNDVAAHRQTGLNTGDDISSKKAVLNIRNERDETITLNAGELTVNVQAGETAGPFEVNAGETGLHITSDSGSQFGANSFSIRESYRYDVIVFGTDYVSRVFSNSIVDFSVSQGLNFNGSQNFFIRGVNLRPLKTEVRIGGSRGIKVFDGQCGLIGC